MTTWLGTKKIEFVWHEGWFDDRVFELEAPQEIYDEIDNLKEEMIEILED